MFAVIRFALTLLFAVVASGLVWAGTTSNYSVTEGNSVTITYNLGYTAPAGGIEVEVVSYAATATSGTDYTIASNQLGVRSVSSGQSSLTVVASVATDSLTEGDEAFAVGFIENIASNSAFDGGAPEWSGATIVTQDNVDLTSMSVPLGNNVLHLANKDRPYRDVTLTAGQQYSIDFKWSEASGDGFGNNCDDSSVYSGSLPSSYVNYADTLQLEVIDLVDSSNNTTFTIYNQAGTGGLAEIPGDEFFQFNPTSQTLNWSGNSSVRMRFTVFTPTGSFYEGYCGFVVDDFKINKQIAQSTITISDPDTTPPTVSITSTDVTSGDTSNDSSIALRFALSEAATDFTSSDISVTNGAISSFAGSGTSYTATFTPSSDGATSISVPANRFTDAAANGNTASATFSWTYDGTGPTSTISSTAVADNASSNASSVTLTFTTSESTTDFAVGDLTVSNASVTGFTGSGTSYSASINPISEGTVTVTMPSGRYSDAYGNQNTGTASYRWTYDTTDPTVTISSTDVNSGDTSNDSSIGLSFTLSEAATDFTASDISVTNGTISGFSGSGTSYSATFTPAANGATSISVPASRFTDAASNDNAASAVFSWTYDGVAPTVSITSATVSDGATSNDSTIALSFTTSKATSDFTASDITTTNGSVSSFAGSGTSYTATFTPAANGATSISVPANAFTDNATNGNAASSAFTWTYNPQPTIAFSAATASASEATSSATITVSLSHSYYQAVSASYAIAGTATGGGQDFTHTNTSVSIPAGSTSASITISPIVDDSLAEGDETIILTLSSPVNASLGSTTTHTYTILDNDGTPSLSIADATTADESATTQLLTVSLSPASSSAVTVDYALTGGTAVSGTDFTFTSGTLSFAAGDTSKTISVAVLSDTDVEGDETVIIGLSNATGGAGIADNSGILTITDDDTAPTTDPNQAVVDEALLDTQTIIAKHVSTQGKDLLNASQNLIQTSIDHMIVRTQLQAKQRSAPGGTQTASRPPVPDDQTTAGAEPSASSSASFTEQDTFAKRLTGAVKLLQAEANDFGYQGALDFDLYEPLSGRNSAFITKITASVSDQDNGPKTSSLLASFALETESTDGRSVYGRFLHLTQTKADFRFTQSGTQDSKSVSGGIYTIYSPKVDHLLTAFVSFGVAQTELNLSVSSAAVNDSFDSLNAQAGVALARTIHRPGMMMVWEMAAESLMSRQQSRYASVLVGSSSYRAQISARTVTDTSAILTPKFIFDLNEQPDTPPANLQLAPSLRCGSGTGGSSCGYGLSTSFSQMMTDGQGHISFGLSADRYRRTDTLSGFIDINRSLLGHKGIRFDTHLKQLVTGGSDGRPNYAINSVVRLPL